MKHSIVTTPAIDADEEIREISYPGRPQHLRIATKDGTVNGPIGRVVRHKDYELHNLLWSLDGEREAHLQFYVENHFYKKEFNRQQLIEHFVRSHNPWFFSYAERRVVPYIRKGLG